MTEVKKTRGRPRKDRSSEELTSTFSIFKEGNPNLLNVLDYYVRETKMTNRELMTAIGFGDTQFYRWGRGESIPRRETLCLLAVEICKRLDTLHKQSLGERAFSSKINFVIAELFEAAGYSFVSGKRINSVWDQINNKKIWRVGYSEYFGITDWGNNSSYPSGPIVDYCNNIANFFGWHIQWVLLSLNELAPALSSRLVDSISPYIPISPDKFVDFRFSEACYCKSLYYAGLVNNQVSNQLCIDPGVKDDKIEIVFVGDETPFWVRNQLTKFVQVNFDTYNKATAYIYGEKERNADKIVVLITNNVTGDVLILNPENTVRKLDIPEIAINFQTAFAVHPEEPKLVEALNLAIQMQDSFNNSK